MKFRRSERAVRSASDVDRHVRSVFGSGYLSAKSRAGRGGLGCPSQLLVGETAEAERRLCQASAEEVTGFG